MLLMRILEVMFLWVFALMPGFPQEPAAGVRVVPAGALAEARQPQAAVDPNGNIYVVYGSKNSIYCSVSRDRAKSFAAPSKVGEAGALALGMRRGPRISATGKYVTVTAVGGSL